VEAGIDKIIVTGFLVIASVVAAMLMINAVLPAISQAGNSIINSADRVNERIETQISIVYGTGELDSTASWVDTDTDSSFDVWIWVKNVGASRIVDIPSSDLFFGAEGAYSRIPYVDDAGGSKPNWDFSLENGTEWKNSNTVKITIHYSSPLASDTYRATFIVPSGGYDESHFSF